ncbi:MAG: FISUMP domain-containing protein, partial [Bacteroidota bacterium]
YNACTSFPGALTQTTLACMNVPCPNIPTVSYEEKTYNTVQIGNQCWLKENLNVGTRINSNQEQTNNAIKEKYCYGDLESNCDVYGGLYQWNEMMQYNAQQGVQGICPSGWHIPTDGEWETLANFLGGATLAGVKMKSTSGWSGNGNGNNISGFTALPGGFRYPDGSFTALTINGHFWSSSEYAGSSALNRYLVFEISSLGNFPYDKPSGTSVRCIQGTGVTSMALVTTTAASNIAQTTATSGGFVINDGGAAVTARGVCYGTSQNPTISDSHTTDGTGTGTFTSTISGLNSSTTYYVRAYATNSVATAYGNQVTCTTTSQFYIGQNYGGGIIFYIDGTGQHGLISSTNDLIGVSNFGCVNTLIGGTSTAFGTGQANTTLIVNGCSELGAARRCDELVQNGFNDWFLPAKLELYQMYLKKDLIGGFTGSWYWSSSENSSVNAWSLGFGTGGYDISAKINGYPVRAIRVF